ncbi:MAG TPA: hypothetical protein VGI55_07550 [Solirubrobacteraceae bacterium]
MVGAASLGAEISAARLLAPYFGASTIIWANTIATVLVVVMRERVNDTNSPVIASADPLSGARIVAAAASGEHSPDLVPLAEKVGARPAPALPGGPVYTDDWAPVAWLTDLSILRYAAGTR